MTTRALNIWELRKCQSQVDVALSQSVVLQVGGWMYFIHLISAMNLSSDPHRYPDQQGWHRDARYKKRFLLETTTLSTDEDCIRLINDTYVGYLCSHQWEQCQLVPPQEFPAATAASSSLTKASSPRKCILSKIQWISMFLLLSFDFKPEGER